MDFMSSALELARALRERELSAVEALDHCLAEVDRLNPDVNAVIWRNDDSARAAAQRADRLLTEDGDKPPFLGVPLPIKDLTEVAGWPVTHGSRGAPGATSEESELTVLAFERAGFVLCGRTNTPEFGTITATENLRYGPTRNPWDRSRTPGGSSGGAGAAVAAGMFPIAHATDGGGSIRIPAACCGLVGLKPSRGRVPRRVQSWEGAVVEGVVSRTVADTAAALDVLAGPDPLGWWNAPPRARPYLDELGADQPPLRVGLLESAAPDKPSHPDCVEAARAAGRLLEELGHSVEPVVFDSAPDDVIPAFRALVAGGTADYDGVDWDRVEPHNAFAQGAATQIDAYSYRLATRFLESRSRELVARWGRDWDVLLTPTMAIPQPEVGTVMAAAHAEPAETPEAVLAMVAFTVFGNLTGLPAISLPVHWSDAGLPTGAQIVAGPWDDAILIRLGAALEQAVGWADRRAEVAVG